ARNGRHFGLVNSMPCVPVGVDDSGLPFYDGRDFTPRWTGVAHRIGRFGLTTQTRTRISENDFDGRIHVASFIYTKCAAVCPRVQTAVRSMPGVVIVSYTVTPDDDTPQALAEFGARRGIDSSRWWLVTGQREQIYQLARTSYFADDSRVGPTAGDTGNEFLHS